MELFSAEIIASFITLSALEVVLGIDNMIFISLVSETFLPKDRNKIRIIGLGLALLMRIAMLFSITWIITLTKPLFIIFEHAFSIHDILMLCGGMFLICKATLEMHNAISRKQNKSQIVGKAGYWSGIFQIVMIDLVFSVDSILTAIGMSKHLPVMIAAVVVAMIIMVFASASLNNFLHKYPTFKILALAFILMIGLLLILEGVGVHVPKGYIYFAFGFAMSVEALNAAARNPCP